MDDGDEVQVFFSDPTYTDPDDDSDGYYWFQDCDDNDSDRSPGLSEWLNGIDDDCDEDVDEDFLNTDADRDGLVDIDEYNIHMTEWQDADTDDDGLNDGYELFQGTNPLFADLDNDGDGFDGSKIAMTTIPTSAPMHLKSETESMTTATERLTKAYQISTLRF